jgi:hypothetical protein
LSGLTDCHRCRGTPAAPRLKVRDAPRHHPMAAVQKWHQNFFETSNLLRYLGSNGGPLKLIQGSLSEQIPLDG